MARAVQLGVADTILYLHFLLLIPMMRGVARALLVCTSGSALIKWRLRKTAQNGIGNVFYYCVVYLRVHERIGAGQGVSMHAYVYRRTCARFVPLSILLTCARYNMFELH